MIQRYLIHCWNRLRRAGRAPQDSDPGLPLRQPAPGTRSPWGTHDRDGERIPHPGASTQPLRETPKVVIQPQPKAYGAPSYQVYAWGMEDQYGDLLNPAASQMSALRDCYRWALSKYPTTAVEVVLYEETPGPKVAPASRWLI